MNAPLKNLTKNIYLAQEVENAKTVFLRLKGLLGRHSLGQSQTLWIEPCNSIHTCFMKFNIDALFVDPELRVKKVVFNINPWRLVLPVFGANSVFEFAAGALTPDKVMEGDQLYVGH